ncbi:MAG: dynamin family protein [Tannerella sp.]|nr:dynamin family protein [Tannerella sp.]
MVAGEAKSGKSTFINAYLGTEILPMDVQQCTSALIEINHGDEKSLEAVYADGRREIKNGDEEIKNFLKEHAALNDNYRKIPVTTINNGLLIKSKGDTKSSDIEDLIEGVKDDNTYNLDSQEYERLIRDYINDKKNSWCDIVTEMKISYPLFKDMQDTTIIDSPGINASGMVGDITEKHLKKADALILVKSLVGQAIESKAFKNFLSSSARDRFEGSLLLILSGKVAHTPEDVDKLEKQSKDMFRGSIDERKITSVDSKLQLFWNICKEKNEEEIDDFLDKAGFDAAENRWYKKSKKDRIFFLDLLAKDSNFGQLNQMLEEFGRTAKNKQLYDFLSLIGQSYEIIIKILEERLDLLNKSAENPKTLKLEIEKKIDEINNIQLKMNQGIKEIRSNYISSEANRIKQKADADFELYRQEVSEVDTVDGLKKKAFAGQEKFNLFREEMQKQIINECNKKLVAFSEATSIPFESLAPVFTEEAILRIEEDTKKTATVDMDVYDEIFCFLYKSETRPVYSEDKHIETFQKAIVKNLENTKTQMITTLYGDTTKITSAYGQELAKNAKQKQEEYSEFQLRLKKAEDVQKAKETVKKDLDGITGIKKQINELKGGIENVIGK